MHGGAGAGLLGTSTHATGTRTGPRPAPTAPRLSPRAHCRRVWACWGLRPTPPGVEPAAGRFAVCRSCSDTPPDAPCPARCSPSPMAQGGGASPALSPQAHCRPGGSAFRDLVPRHRVWNRPQPALRSADLAPALHWRASTSSLSPVRLPARSRLKNPRGRGLFNLGRLTGLEPATPGITRKVLKLVELVVVRVRGGVPGVTPHIHHKVFGISLLVVWRSDFVTPPVSASGR